MKAASERYQNLKSDCEGQLDKLQLAADRQKQFQGERLKVDDWLTTAEDKMHALQSEPVKTEPAQLQEQLYQVKVFTTETITQGKNIDDLKKVSNALEDSLKDLGADEDTLKDIESGVDELQDRLNALTAESTAWSNKLQTALVQSQGAQEGMDSLFNWLHDTEGTLNNMRPVSLSQDNLNDQMRELVVVKSDVESHVPSVKSVKKSSRDVADSSDPVTAKVIDDKMADLTDRFDDLADRIIQRDKDLNEVADKLSDFNDGIKKHDEWLVPTIEMLESINNSQVDSPAFKDKLAEISQDSAAKGEELAMLKRLGRELIDHPHTGDSAGIKDGLVHLERNWHDFKEVMSERQQESDFRDEKGNRYQEVRDQVDQWLGDAERRVDQLQPAAIDIEVIEQQIEELQPLLTEYEEHEPIVDEVNDLGNQFDAIQRGEQLTSPIRRSE